MNLFLLSQCASVHRILGWKYGIEPRISFLLAGFIIIEDQQELIFLFSDYWTALSREGSQASRKNICLSKAKPVSITALSSTFWTPTHFYQRFTLFNLYIISLTRYAPKSPLSVTPFYLFIKEWKVCEGVKHPPYCLFTRETRALTDLTSYVAQLALYEPKSEENTIFRACLSRLAHKAPVMQAKPICRGTVRPWIIQRLLLSMARLSHGRFRLID